MAKPAVILVVGVLDSSIVLAFVGSIISLITTSSSGAQSTPLQSVAMGFATTTLLNFVSSIILPRVFDLLVLNSADLLPTTLARNKTKFQEMFLSIILLSISSRYLYDIFQATDWLWWKDTTQAWTGTPPAQDVEFFYSFTIGTWITNATMCRFFEVKNRDWLLMYTHHALTVMLICGSYVIHQERIGCMILFLHQVSDIVLNMCQFAHYLGWDMDHFPLSLPIAEVLFAANIASWIYSRIYILPTVIIHSTFTDMHDNEFCGDWSKGRYYCDGLALFLCTLQAMHVWWLYEMLSVAWKIVSGVKTEDAAKSYLEEDKKKKKEKSM